MPVRIQRSTWALVAVMLAPLAWAQDKPADDPAKTPPAIGQEAPAFELTDLAGNTHRLSDYRGKIVVLHFQSRVCPWDRAYQPHFNQLARKHQEQAQAAKAQGQEAVEVVFLAINANRTESVEELQSYHEEVGMPYPILKDEGNKVADLYAARTTPHMFVIDAEGILRYKGGVEKPPVGIDDVYHMDEQYLEPAIEAVIQGAEPPFVATRSKGCMIQRVR